MNCLASAKDWSQCVLRHSAQWLGFAPPVTTWLYAQQGVSTPGGMVPLNKITGVTLGRLNRRLNCVHTGEYFSAFAAVCSEIVGCRKDSGPLRAKAAE